MSEFGAIVDAIEADVRAASGITLPASDAGFERFKGKGPPRSEDHLPHVFAYDPSEVGDELSVGQQIAAVFQVTLDYWRKGTQDDLAADLDAIRDQIAADRTLAGTVDAAFVQAREIHDASAAGKTIRLGRLVIQARRVI